MTNLIEKNELLRVPASRLAGGALCRESNRWTGEGDISASYSADVIALEGRIRKPFRLNGWLHTTVSISGKRHSPVAKAYRLIDSANFNGTRNTYHEATHSEDGFYHGIEVRHGKAKFVLVGPPVMIGQSHEAEFTQADLFGELS